MEIKTICVLGLGYVGLPLALALDKHFKVIGFDVVSDKIASLKQGIDPADEWNKEEILSSKINFTSDPTFMKQCECIIACVPTPINKAKSPDLKYMESASQVIGEHMNPGTIVVFESTVYPGVTEDICVPLLEKYSKLKCGIDFKVGYSPERINPGDKEHTINKVTKIVSGMDAETLEQVNYVYSKITKTHKASSIKVAEAAKVIENIQRDLNIALVNELSIIFSKMGIKTKDVLEAAYSKWNFHQYKPGLVGGHCIGVDPYYLTHKANEIGHHAEVILAGRKINDNMYKHVVEQLIRGLNKSGKVLQQSTVMVMGLTFKENVKDFRNSKAEDIINELKSYGVTVYGCDPLLTSEITQKHFSVENKEMHDLSNIDALIFLSPHNQFKEINFERAKQQMKNDPLILDLKSTFDEKKLSDLGFSYISI